MKQSGSGAPRTQRVYPILVIKSGVGDPETRVATKWLPKSERLEEERDDCVTHIGYIVRQGVYKKSGCSSGTGSDPLPFQTLLYQCLYNHVRFRDRWINPLRPARSKSTFGRRH